MASRYYTSFYKYNIIWKISSLKNNSYKSWVIVKLINGPVFAKTIQILRLYSLAYWEEQKVKNFLSKPNSKPLEWDIFSRWNLQYLLSTFIWGDNFSRSNLEMDEEEINKLVRARTNGTKKMLKSFISYSQ